MKQSWQKLAARIDALSVRERAIIFAMLALFVVMSVNFVLIEPKFIKQKQLAERMRQDQSRITVIQAQIGEMVRLQTADPDSANRANLKALKSQVATMQAGMRDMKSHLVAPDKMPQLLGNILKQNGRLRLMSLKTLEVTGLNGPVNVPATMDKAATAVAQVPAAKNAAGGPATAAGNAAIYKHGVEITVQGNYLDMVKYMSDLEAMPWQLFWGKAKLEVLTYPTANLTLTLFTLSLDKKWLNI